MKWQIASDATAARKSKVMFCDLNSAIEKHYFDTVTECGNNTILAIPCIWLIDSLKAVHIIE
jgi:hypothetical protein